MPAHQHPQDHEGAELESSEGRNGAARTALATVLTHAPDSAEARALGRRLEGLPDGVRAEAVTAGPPLFTNTRDQSTMVHIPAGLYTCGRANGPLDEAPRHKVRLSGFYLDRDEVTNARYAKFLAWQKKANRTWLSR